MSIDETTWKWLKTAPLPVVLAISLLGFGTLGTWVWAVSNEVTAAKSDAAVAKVRAENAERAATRAEDKMDKALDKLDKLLEAVAAMSGHVKNANHLGTTLPSPPPQPASPAR
jgi:hypothetical protein